MNEEFKWTQCHAPAASVPLPCVETWHSRALCCQQLSKKSQEMEARGTEGVGAMVIDKLLS